MKNLFYVYSPLLLIVAVIAILVVSIGLLPAPRQKVADDYVGPMLDLRFLYAPVASAQCEPFCPIPGPADFCYDHCCFLCMPDPTCPGPPSPSEQSCIDWCMDDLCTTQG